MPVEILEHISIHLDDKSLLWSSHVCKSFASAAETAFAQKYSNRLYKVDKWLDENMAFHEGVLFKYGSKIRMLDISVAKEDERLLDLAEQTCSNLNCLKLHWTPKIIHATGLTEAHLVFVKNLDTASFTEFINHNQQLEFLRLNDSCGGLLGVLNGLNALKNHCNIIALAVSPKIYRPYN